MRLRRQPENCPTEAARRRAGAALAWLGMTLLVLAGCTNTLHIKHDLLPSSRSQAMVSSWPLTVGVYVAPQARGFEAKAGLWRLPAGPVMAHDFEWAVRQMFDRVVSLEEPPRPGTMRPGLSGALSLEAVQYDPFLYNSADPGALDNAGLRYHLRLANAQGETMDEWSLRSAEMLWDAQDSSTVSLIQSQGTGFAYMMRNLIAEMMVRFDARPTVRAWLDAQGATGRLEPALRATAPASTAPQRILVLPDLDRWLHTDASRPLPCLGRTLGQLGQHLELLPASVVRLDFYPWLEPSTGPRTADSLHRWFKSPAIQTHARALGIRHMLVFTGATDTDISRGGILCGAGYGGGGCVGFAWGERNTAFRVNLLRDVFDGKDVDVVSETTGAVLVPAFGLPIPIIAATESTACRRLRRALTEALASP
ncbi:MAG: hypothetical protein ACK5YW_04415 [Betaproteobacteria bacterium]|jgi:hypothetical protein|nr:hypothetical protein [Rhodocyclaceae bacterium]MCE2898908.1 hypothetical protein [Betaproteobacteria bacterium]